jgi:hypothetical protein
LARPFAWETQGQVARLRAGCEAERCQESDGGTDPKFLQCCPARDRLGQCFGHFIECVIHDFSFAFGLLFIGFFAWKFLSHG